MAAGLRACRTSFLAAAVVFAGSTAFAQAPPAPVPTATATAPASPPSPVGGIRNKLSANDLPSAESILEVHGQKNGEDGQYLVGLSWLARGALMLNAPEKARRYVADVRRRCADSLAKGVDAEKSHEVETALGAAIEVEAMMIQQARGAKPAAAYVRQELARLHGPVALISRLHKRVDLLEMAGAAAPELAVEDHLGDSAPSLAGLRGKPVVVFVWAQTCGDSRAQAAALARVAGKHAASGLRIVALTRYYEPDSARASEKARADSVWRADYQDIPGASVVFSTASMERYGGSSTPTLVFVDRAGIVRGYTPTRLTEADLERRVAAIAR